MNYPLRAPHLHSSSVYLLGKSHCHKPAESPTGTVYFLRILQSPGTLDLFIQGCPNAVWLCVLAGKAPYTEPPWFMHQLWLFTENTSHFQAFWKLGVLSLYPHPLQYVLAPVIFCEWFNLPDLQVSWTLDLLGRYNNPRPVNYGALFQAPEWLDGCVYILEMLQSWSATLPTASANWLNHGFVYLLE